MPTTKILTALMFGLIGFWALTLISEGEATHILISDTAAHPTYSGSLIATFRIDNRGAPDRLTGVTSRLGTAHLRGAGPHGLAIPAGSGTLSAAAGHIRIDTTVPLAEGASVPVQLQFEQAGTVSAVLRYSPLAATEMTARISRFDPQRGMAAPDPAPAVTLSARPDGAGWRVSLTTSDFVFTGQPGAASAAASGYAELFADGTRLGRIADPVVQVGALPPGPVALRVILTAPDGTPYVSTGAPIGDSLTLTVP